MFTFVIGLFVVGAALVFAIKVTGNAEPNEPKPATPVARRVRDTRPTPAVTAPELQVDDPGRLRRLRSAVALAVLLTMLGALAALAVVVGGAILLTGLRTAVQ